MFALLSRAVSNHEPMGVTFGSSLDQMGRIIAATQFVECEHTIVPADNVNMDRGDWMERTVENAADRRWLPYRRLDELLPDYIPNK